MECKFCGKELVNGAIYCNHCGRKIEGNQQDSEAEISVDNEHQEDDSLENKGANKSTNHDNFQIFVYLFFILCTSYSILKVSDNQHGNNLDYTSYKNNSVAESIIERYSAEDVRKELELGILQQRRTLPTSLGEGMTMTNIELVGKNIVHTTILEGVKPFDYTQQMIDEIKNNILSSGVLEENMRRILHEYGYGIIYTYINEHNEYLYDIKISSDEL